MGSFNTLRSVTGSPISHANSSSGNNTNYTGSASFPYLSVPSETEMTIASASITLTKRCLVIYNMYVKRTGGYTYDIHFRLYRGTTLIYSTWVVGTQYGTVVDNVFRYTETLDPGTYTISFKGYCTGGFHVYAGSLSVDAINVE